MSSGVVTYDTPDGGKVVTAFTVFAWLEISPCAEPFVHKAVSPPDEVAEGKGR